MDFTPMDHLIPLNQEFVVSICRDPHDVHLAIKEAQAEQSVNRKKRKFIINKHYRVTQFVTSLPRSEINRLMFNQNSSEECLFNWWHSRFTLPIKFHCVKRELIGEHLLSSRAHAQLCCLLASTKNFYRRGSFRDKRWGEQKRLLKRALFYCTGIFEVNIERRNFVCSPKRLSSLEKSARCQSFARLFDLCSNWLLTDRAKSGGKSRSWPSTRKFHKPKIINTRVGLSKLSHQRHPRTSSIDKETFR